MEFFIIIIAIIAAIWAAFYVLGRIIGFVRIVGAQHGTSFFNIAFVCVAASWLAVIISMFSQNEQTIFAILIFGLWAVAAFINYKIIGGWQSFAFTAIQIATVYASILAFIAWVVFKSVSDRS